MRLWDGDSLVSAFPCFAFEEPLSLAILENGLTGVTFEALEMSKNPEYALSLPTTDLPPFVRGIIVGEKGEDDFYLSKGFDLIISKRALELLKTFTVKYGKVEKL